MPSREHCVIEGVDKREIGVGMKRERLVIFFLILAALGLTVYSAPLYSLLGDVLQRKGSSHGLFVPFICGYLIWLKVDRIKGLTTQTAVLPGVTVMMAAFALYYLGRSDTGYVLGVLSFLLVAAGVLLVLFGEEVFKEVKFPFFFLAAMIPLPDSVYGQVAEWMRHSSTWGAVALLEPLDIPLHRDGYDIYLPNIHLVVDEACSGIRYLLSYLVFGLAYAFRFKQSTEARVLVLAVALALSIVGGVLRLGIVFSTAYYIGPVMTQQRPHELLSWSVFTVLLVGAIGVDRYLEKRRRNGAGA
jgi:exosortase